MVSGLITRGFRFVCRRSSRTSSVNTTRVGSSSARDEHVTSTRCATMKCETCSSSASSAATGGCRDTMGMFFALNAKMLHVNELFVTFPMVWFKTSRKFLCLFDVEQTKNLSGKKRLLKRQSFILVR